MINTSEDSSLSQSNTSRFSIPLLNKAKEFWNKYPSLHSVKALGTIAVLLVIIISVPVTVFISQQNQDIRQKASYEAANPINFSTLSFYKLFGQRYPTEIARNTVTQKKVYHAAGVIVDKSSTPNKVYVADTGNNRVLGFNGIGFCSHNAAQTCTVNADCGNGNTCRTDGSKDPDIVFGQPDFSRGACNRDDNLGIFKDPAANTLCFTGKPVLTNIAELWKRTNFDVDAQGNLYVADHWNNRVLKYNQPFSTDTSGGKGDTVADFVWGQNSLTENKKNGVENYQPGGTLSNRTLWLNDKDSNLSSYGGVSIDRDGNIWVADSLNRRILRFRNTGQEIDKEADLVIGQQNFTSLDTSQCGNVQRTQVPLTHLCNPLL